MDAKSPGAEIGEGLSEGQWEFLGKVVDLRRAGRRGEDGEMGRG